MAKTDETAKTEEAKEQPEEFVVLHGNVGPYWQGEKITRAHFAKDIDWERLVRLKAIAPVGSPEGAAALAALGPDTGTPGGNTAGTVVPPSLQTGNPTKEVQDKLTAEQQGASTDIQAVNTAASTLPPPAK